MSPATYENLKFVPTHAQAVGKDPLPIMWKSWLLNEPRFLIVMIAFMVALVPRVLSIGISLLISFTRLWFAQTFRLLKNLSNPFVFSIWANPYSSMEKSSKIVKKETLSDSIHGDATCIIADLPSDKIYWTIFVPLVNGGRASSSSSSSLPRYGFGPSFKSFPEDLTPYFPFNLDVGPAYQRKGMDWDEWDTFTISSKWYRVLEG